MSFPPHRFSACIARWGQTTIASTTDLTSMSPAASDSYPIATIAAYGPTAARATKLVIAIFTAPSQQQPLELRQWLRTEGDIRNDPGVAEEIRKFVVSHGVKRAVSPPHILGCPHEEGIDYPTGESCPHCPFWANLSQAARNREAPWPASGAAKTSNLAAHVGRNDPCPCGSGRKFKRCCGH